MENGDTPVKPAFIVIPDTIEAATAALGGIDRLLTAKGWEKAAIVYAFTRDGERGPGGSGKTVKSDSFSCSEFAALGINGLRAPRTVRMYREAWQLAIEEGWAKAVEPGDMALLPPEFWPDGRLDDDGSPLKTFPPMRQSTNGIDEDVQAGSSPERKAKAVEKLLADPAVRKAAESVMVEMLSESSTSTYQVNRRYLDKHPVPAKPQPTPDQVRWNAMIGLGGDLYVRVQRGSEGMQTLVDWLHESRLRSDEERECIRENVRDLRKAANLLNEYAERIEDAFGEQVEALDFAWIDRLLTER